MTRRLFPSGSFTCRPLALAAMLSLCSAGPLACSSSSGNRGGFGDEGGSSGSSGKGGSGGRAGSGGKGGASGEGGAAGEGGSGEGGSAGGSGGGGGGASGGAGGAAAKLPGDGCAGGTCLNKECKALGTPAPISGSAEIGFELQPQYIPNYAVIPTYDDAPDGAIDPNDPTAMADFITYGKGSWTKQIVDYLDSKKLHADFFINTNNWCGNVLDAPDCMAVITSILKTQNPANHTVHHMHMFGNTVFDPMDLSSASCGGAGAMFSCEKEMSDVELIIDMLSGGARPHLTRFRSPYGEPFQVGGAGISEARNLAKKYAVHVGWQFDTQDSKCDSGVPPCITAKEIVDAVAGFLGNAPGAGRGWGVILMHGTYPWSYEATKTLFDPDTGWVKTHGFKMATVEDAICWKYGKHSWEIIQQLGGQPRGPN